MYQVGERIIYGGIGVCEVRAVGPLESVGGDRLYYTLVPLYGSGVIYAPVDGPVFNRPLLTPQELHGLLEQFSEMWLSLLVSHIKVLKMGQRIVHNKGMTPKREKMRHVKETEDAP